MREYKFEDYNIGEGVYHKSNIGFKMIIIRLDSETKEIKCRWLDRNGIKNEDSFLFVELVKSDDSDYDSRPRIVSAII